LKLEQKLGNYYGMVMVRSFKDDIGRPHLAKTFGSADIEDLVRLAQDYGLGKKIRFKIESITFWRKPSPEIEAKSHALVKLALERIYTDLSAARSRFPELSSFDKQHVRISGGSLVYQSSARGMRKEKNEKVVPPWFLISLERPDWGKTQIALVGTIYLPVQRVAANSAVYVKDKSLALVVNQCMDKAVRPLVEYEKKLGSSPVEAR
jgi:hypothetical protein